MTKLTTDILLKKGLPKSNHLKNLKTLNLSKMQLETKDIDPKLFSQMVNLEELDLSNNSLSEMPENISLPKLKVLNFSDNQVEDVTSLQQFPNLEEIMYEENLYLTISDNYKVCCLLSKLRRLNNKDITSLANHVRFVNHRELSSRVENYWEKTYKDKLPDEPTPAMIKSISKEFLKSVVNHVKYGPNSLKDFTKWKVNIIAEEITSSLLSKKKHPELLPEPVVANDDDIEIPSTPGKRKRTGESIHEVETPTKRLRSSEILSHALSPRRSSRAQESPQISSPTRNKLNIALSPLTKSKATPVKELDKRGLSTPQKVSLKSTPSKKASDEDRSVDSGRQKKEAKKQQFQVEPVHFLQCHSKNNSSDDFRTQLWSCAFEPALDSVPSKVIATCGGESVCVIDCETGKVLKKYKVPGEEFFSLAWTTLTMISNEGKKRRVNVLTAGGKCGVVRLMHPKVNMCYGEIKAHKKAISIMCFSPVQDTFLFTGSYDNRIILWDIGVPDYDYNFRASQLLTLDAPSTPLRLCLVPSSPEKYLLAGCEGGCYVWEITLNKQGKRSYDTEFSFPIYKKKSEESNFRTIDGLAFLNDDLIASKSSMQGSIYIWSWKKTSLKQRSKSSKNVEAAVLAELKWSQTKLSYLTLTTSAEGLSVFCGDEDGKVWIYDLDSCQAELQKGASNGALKDPTKVINWPAPVSKKEKMEETIINTVLVNPAKEYLVALTDKNIIVIWKIL